MKTRILIAAFAIMCAMTAFAIPTEEIIFEKDGLKYQTWSLTDGVVSLIGHNLQKNKWNEEFEIPGHVTDESGNEYEVIHIGTHALAGLYIRHLTVPPTIQSIDSEAFSWGRILHLTLKPGNLRIIKSESLSYVYSCETMTVLEIPEGVCAIASFGLYNSELYGTLVLPSTLKTIAPRAFIGCGFIGRVVVKAIEPPFMTDAAFGLNGYPQSSPDLSIVPIGVDNIVLAVPKGCVEKYREASGWSRFVHIEEMTPEEAAGIVGIPTDYPSPAIEASGSRGAITVKANSATAVRITDVQGRTVASATINGSHTFSLPQGIYIVSASRHSIKVKVD